MRLEEHLKPQHMLILEDVADREALLQALAHKAAEAFPQLSEAQLLRALEEREAQAPTSTPEGVGFPHALLPEVQETAILVARLPRGVQLSQEHPPVDLAFCMIGAAEAPWRHVRLLARLARLARAEGALERFRKAATPEELYEALLAEDRAHV